MKIMILVQALILAVPLIVTAETVDINCDTPALLQVLRPGAIWAISPKDGIKWMDKKQKQPSQSELNDAKKECVQRAVARKVLVEQARLDVKNTAAPIEQRFNALILLLDMDK